MKRYTVTKIYLHTSGEIGLTAAQAEPRKHMLEPVPGGFLPKGELCFKVGEIIWLESVPVSLQGSLQPVFVEETVETEKTEQPAEPVQKNKPGRKRKQQ